MHLVNLMQVQRHTCRKIAGLRGNLDPLQKKEEKINIIVNTNQTKFTENQSHYGNYPVGLYPECFQR